MDLGLQCACATDSLIVRFRPRLQFRFGLVYARRGNEPYSVEHGKLYEVMRTFAYPGAVYKPPQKDNAAVDLR